MMYSGPAHLAGIGVGTAAGAYAPRRTTTDATHERYIHAVREAVVARLVNTETGRRLMAVKLVYGVGAGMAARGVTLFQRWQNGEPAPLDLVEVCAAGEESPVQLAGTTVHELAHVMAGWGAGHDREWKRAAGELGLRHAEAAGQDYTPDHFDPDLWAAIAALGEPSDGRPAFARIGASGGPLVAVPGVRPTRSPRPCSLGIGTRGGRSRGPGSGSRLRLWVCACPVRVRVASDDFRATCGRCGETFTRGGAS